MVYGDGTSYAAPQVRFGGHVMEGKEPGGDQTKYR